MNGLFGKLSLWLEHRTGLITSWRAAANREISGGARLRHAFPSVLMFLFIQQAVLGIAMATYYSPSNSDAWASVAYLNDQVTLGWFLRGLHHHGTYAMLIVSAIYVLHLILVAGYRRPRELHWLTAVGILAMTVALALSGSLLPWDEQAIGRLAVETGIMAGVPGGELQKTLLLGGGDVGNLTVLRLYAVHVFVLPALFLLIMLAHRAQVVRHGEIVPALPQAELERTRARFFPNQLFVDVLAITVVSIAVVIWTTRSHGAELFGPPLPDSKFVARPEPYFLPLFQLLKYFHGPSQIIATAILPGAVVAFIVALPWLDRAESASFSKRMPVLAGVGAIMVGASLLAALAIGEDRNDAEYKKALAAGLKSAGYARELAIKGVLPEGNDAVLRNDPKWVVKTLFKEHCQNCHMIDGIGGTEAPDLTDYNSREWLTALVRNAKDKRFFGGTKREDGMDPYPEDKLSNDDLKSVVEYLLLLSGPEVARTRNVDASLAAKGQKFFEDSSNCSDCHEVKPGETGDGPNLFSHGAKEWLVRVMKDSSAEDLFGKEAQMPKFETKLTEGQMLDLADFILTSAAGPAPGG